MLCPNCQTELIIGKLFICPKCSVNKIILIDVVKDTTKYKKCSSCGEYGVYERP